MPRRMTFRITCPQCGWSKAVHQKFGVIMVPDVSDDVGRKSPSVPKVWLPRLDTLARPGPRIFYRSDRFFY
jgi:hypothetical protein